eukprot:1872768-Rhodomonas_salina.1
MHKREDVSFLLQTCSGKPIKISSAEDFNSIFKDAFAADCRLNAMDFVKDVGDKYHDAIQQSVERKADDASGLQTPRVVSTPATCQRNLRSNADRVNPPGPEGAGGDIAFLQEGGSSSSQALTRGGTSTAPLTVLSLDDPLFKTRWKQ